MLLFIDEGAVMLYDTINQSAERDYFDQLQLSNVLTFSRLLYFLLA